MRLPVSCLTVSLVLAHALALGCSSDSDPVAQKLDSGLPDGGTGDNVQTVGRFYVAMETAAEPDGLGDPFTYVTGTVNDGPAPVEMINTQEPLPPDATPGCAVYRMSAPVCAGIGGCALGSSNADCAAAAVTGVNTCVCVATDKCQARPIKKDVGDVTVSGVNIAGGATSFQLVNLGNAYNVDAATTVLSYPGFDESSTIKISATGGDYAKFEITSKGVAELQLTPDSFNLARDPSSDDPTRYQALTLGWNAPAASANPGHIWVDLNISRHGANVGFLGCDVEDNGSLTISASLISQLVALGGIGGYPEIFLIRSATSSATIAPGKVELVVESEQERFPTIDGYRSCERTSDCLDGQTCDTGNLLCTES